MNRVRFVRIPLGTIPPSRIRPRKRPLALAGLLPQKFAQWPAFVATMYVCGFVHLLGYLKAFNLRPEQATIRNVDLLANGCLTTFLFVLPVLVYALLLGTYVRDLHKD